MGIKLKLKGIIEKTLNNIRNGKFKLVEIGRFESKIQYRGDILDVWTANGVESCKISNYGDLTFPPLSDEDKKIVFELATTQTESYLKHKLKEARKNKKGQYAIYKDCSTIVENLKLKLNELKNG